MLRNSLSHNFICHVWAILILLWKAIASNYATLIITINPKFILTNQNSSNFRFSKRQVRYVARLSLTIERDRSTSIFMYIQCMYLTNLTFLNVDLHVLWNRRKNMKVPSWMRIIMIIVITVSVESEIFMQKSDSMWRLQFPMKLEKRIYCQEQPWPSVLSPPQCSVYFLASWLGPKLVRSQ